MAETTKPKIFAFVNGSTGMGRDVFGAAIAEDGTVLRASHVSSNASFCRHDMGADGRSTWKHEVYAAHYPAGFEVEWVEDVEGHPVLAEIIARLNTQREAEDPALAAERETAGEV